MNTRTRITFFVLITLFLGGVVVFEFVKIASLSNQAQAILAQAEERSGNDLRMRSIKMIQASSQNDIATLETATLKQNQFAGLVDSLEKMAKTLGLSVSVTSIKSEAEVVEFQIETDGAWRGSLNFVHLLQSLPYKFVIEATSLNNTGKAWHSTSLIKLNFLTDKI